MGSHKRLTDKEATELKRQLWEGLPREGISENFLLTLSTIANINTGRQYPEIKWPDGSDGALPAARARELNRTLHQKRKLGQAGKLGHRGKLSALSRQGGQRPQTLEEVIQEKHPTLAATLAKFGKTVEDFTSSYERVEKKIAEERSKKPDKELDKLLKELKTRRGSNPMTDDLEAEPLPLATQKEHEKLQPRAEDLLSWDKVLAGGQKLEIVKRAAGRKTGPRARPEDPRLKKAIQLYFKVLPLALWADKTIWPKIEDLASQLA